MQDTALYSMYFVKISRATHEDSIILQLQDKSSGMRFHYSKTYKMIINQKMKAYSRLTITLKN